MAEARLEDTGGGLAPATEGWFVVNVRHSSWLSSEVLGDCCIFEGGEVEFPELGFTIAVLESGQSGGRYHGESNQEDFLVLAGECVLLIEGEERRLRAWDFVHCPPWTEHAFVGAGDGPCVDLHGRRAPSRAPCRLSALGARTTPRRRSRGGDDEPRRGLRAAPEVAAGQARLRRIALGVMRATSGGAARAGWPAWT